MPENVKVYIGLAVFVVFVAMPVWWQVLGANEPPTLDEPKGDACVEGVEFMRAKHMDLLSEWRNEVVREGVRKYVSSTDIAFEMSLTGTCLDCHESKQGFCDECHDYTGVHPDCWECHVDPEEVQ